MARSGPVAAHNLTAGEVVLALRAANLQVAAGSINQAPAVSPGAFTLSVQTLGRLTSPEEFGNIVLRAETDGSVTRLRDVARIELGAQDYTVNAYLDNKNATALGIFQRPGSNALATVGPDQGDDGAAEEGLPARPRLFGRLQSDGVHPGLGRRGDRRRCSRRCCSS